ncbi:MAG: hypothetical protein ACD_28C00300G0011 [uncultured bacterium]|nr:MAG: hypothetical protein ACD_28C00300G0011 [uncultured bacterium]
MLKLSEKYVILFGLQLLFFFGILFYLSWLRLTWNTPFEDGNPVEVALPVMDWGRYSNLPKQYPDDNVI